jgi:CHRD domain
MRARNWALIDLAVPRGCAAKKDSMKGMVITIVALAAVVAAAAVGAPSSSAQATSCVFTTQLLAANETTGSTSVATGHSQIKIEGDGTLEFKTHIRNPAGEAFVPGHVHNAPVGVAGMIVVPLFAGSTTAAHIVQRGSVAMTAALAAAICANPENYYVNYHTTAFPVGQSGVSSDR